MKTALRDDRIIHPIGNKSTATKKQERSGWLLSEKFSSFNTELRFIQSILFQYN